MNNLPIQTYESVVQQRDALAAENAAMKENIENVLSHWAAAEPGDMSWMMDKCMPSLRDSCIETPATDAYLAEVQAQGVDKLAIFAGKEYQRFVGDKPTQRKWKGVVMLCTDFAVQLRKGINDAQ